MILLPKQDELIKVAISTTDMETQPTEMVISSVQKKDNITLKLVDVRTNERCGIYQFFVIGSADTYNQLVQDLSNEPHLLDAFNEFGTVTFNSTTFINGFINAIPILQGTYNYRIGKEVGLMQVGIPTLSKKEYTSTSNNSIYYEG